MHVKKKGIWKKILLAVLLILLLAIVGVLAWSLLDSYPADAEAAEFVQTAQNLEKRDNLYILYPEEPNGAALVFYPGAKVEETAYLPLLNQIARQGTTCILVHMPCHFALFDMDAAEAVREQFPEMERWYLAGHSMGGAMAASFASKHPEQFDGLILLAANRYSGYPEEKTLMIYGSLDGLAAGMDHVEHTVEIPGGNHAQFGSYGKQPGDPDAAISDAEQKAITVDAIVQFIG